METLNELFEVIKFEPFLVKYTDVKPGSGIRHRKTGKGTREGDKKKGFTEQDIEAIKAGLTKLNKDIKKTLNSL